MLHKALNFEGHGVNSQLVTNYSVTIT